MHSYAVQQEDVVNCSRNHRQLIASCFKFKVLHQLNIMRVLRDEEGERL